MDGINNTLQTFDYKLVKYLKRDSENGGYFLMTENSSVIAYITTSARHENDIPYRTIVLDIL